MNEMKRRVVFIHTSPAAVGPLMQYYVEAAPELEITNLLDDGILRFFAAERMDDARRRLDEMIKVAREVYEAELAMITCSAVPKAMLEQLRAGAGIPLLKIDDPMARLAAQSGKKIGVAVTFPPTLEPTTKLLNRAAFEAGVAIEILSEVVPEAYRALLAGEHQKHDGLLLTAVERLEERGVDAIVLAQVSMARILPQLAGRVSVPVLSSLNTSLTAIREMMEDGR